MDVDQMRRFSITQNATLIIFNRHICVQVDSLNTIHAGRLLTHLSNPHSST